MGGCSATGCRNIGTNGLMLKSFPKDPALLAVWMVKIRRPGWKPTKTSKICEKHFDEYQWEKPRQDGKRKLKWNAIPTIFAHSKPIKPRKPPTIRKPLEKPIPKRRKTVAEKDVDSKKINDVKAAQDSVNVASVERTPPQNRNLAKDGNASTSNDNLPVLRLQKHDEADKDKLINFLKSTIERYRKDLFVKERQVMSLRKLIAENRRQRHRENERNDRLDANLKQVFNEDQLQALGRSSMRFAKWSNTTINIGLELRLSCGLKGYKHLLRLGLPFPSVRTLQRVQAEKTDPRVLQEILEKQTVECL